MCMFDYADEAAVAVTKWRVARKEHRCGECHRQIVVGERYEVCNGLWDGRWDTFKTCQHCVAVRGWLSVVCRGWAYGEVKNDLYEHYQEGYNPRFLAIAVSGMQRHWENPDGTLWKPMRLPKHLPIGAA